MLDKKNNRAKRLSLSGILLALAVITLSFAVLLPTNRLSLYALSSFYIAIIIIEFGIISGWTFYAASCILALILIPGSKIGIIPYVVFFGAYGITKYYIEKINNLAAEIFLKLLNFNLCMGAAAIFIKEFFMYSVKIAFPWWILIVILEVIFVIYDYVYTLFVQYYKTRLKKLLRI